MQGIPFTEILSRTATLSAQATASAAGELSIVTGPQTIDYATGQAAPLSASSPAPALAIEAARANVGAYASALGAEFDSGAVETLLAAFVKIGE